MDKLNEVVKDMDFEYFATGQYGATADSLLAMLENDHFFFLDVRTNEEVAFAPAPFAKHIPFNELPDRLNEVPRDKFVITFCAAVFRGAMAYLFLLANGYEEVKGMTIPYEEIVKKFKPGPLYSLKKK